MGMGGGKTADMVREPGQSEDAFGRGREIAVSDDRRVSFEVWFRSSLREMKGGASSGNWLLKNDELRSPRSRGLLFWPGGGVEGEA